MYASLFSAHFNISIKQITNLINFNNYDLSDGFLLYYIKKLFCNEKSVLQCTLTYIYIYFLDKLLQLSFVYKRLK